MRTADVLVPEVERAFEAERSRKASIETRGLGVLSSASLFTTTILALTAALRDSSKPYPPVAVTLLAVGGVLLLAASGLGLYCAVLPKAYLQLDPTSMLAAAKGSNWNSDGDDAHRQFILARIHILAQWTVKNQFTARITAVAIGIELIGAAAMSSSLFPVIIRLSAQ